VFLRHFLIISTNAPENRRVVRSTRVSRVTCEELERERNCDMDDKKHDGTTVLLAQTTDYEYRGFLYVKSDFPDTIDTNLDYRHHRVGLIAVV
jgi:hypothetical protein